MRIIYISPYGTLGLSHFGPFLPLASALRERGHDTWFVSLERSPHLETLGFESRSQEELGLPPGRLDLLPAAPLLDGCYDAAFVGLEADLFVVDAAISFFCLYLQRLGLRSLRFHTCLPLDERATGLSPTTCRRQIQDDGPLSRARIHRQWLGVALPQRIASWKERLRRRVPGSTPLSKYRSLAVAAGKGASFVNQRAVFPSFPWPEIVACDERFALGYRRLSGRAFTGNQVVDWSPDDADFNWQQLRADAPLVYCSFGSNSGAWKDLEPLLRGLTEVSRRMPDWDFVLAAAARWREMLEPAPSNLHAVEFAPQMALLERASVFITHGGFSSVREAQHHGVPMFLVPIAYEQFGNAARAAHLGLGRAFDLDALPSVSSWVNILRQLATQQPAMHAKLEEERARAADGLVRVVDWLEAF